MTELKKTISIWEGLALAVSMVVGSGLLGLPGLAISEGGIYAAAAGWFFTSVAVIPLIYIFSKLGLKYTSSAGLSRYAQEAVGDWAGYSVAAVLCGTFTVGIPALALIGGAYAQKLMNFSDGSVFLLAIVILGVMTFLNLKGINVASIVNKISLSALIFIVLIIIMVNLNFFSIGLNSAFRIFTDGNLNIHDLWKVSALLFWAFLGWENLSFGLEEFKNPEKSIPLVYWLSFGVVVFLYLSLAVTSIGAQVSGVSVIGASGLVSLVKDTPVGTVLVGVMVLVILANANAWIFGASRLIYASGRQGILPAYLGRLSKHNVPSFSLISLFLFYTAVIIIVKFANLSISNLILLVSQNFLILYVFSILAYWKSESGIRKWLITAAALLSCGFLLSGFSWLILYPITLIILGYLSYRRRIEYNSNRNRW